MADTGLTEVDATIEDIVSLQIQEVLTASMVVPATVMDFSAQVGPGMDNLKIPKFGNFTVEDKAENTALTPAVNAFSTDDLPLDKYQAISFVLEDIAELQSKINVSQAYINQAGRDMGAKVDDELITDMEGNASAAAPDHIADFDNTPTDTLSKGDILNARRLLNIQNVELADRFCLISPGREADILAISEFVRVDESGGSAALRNGEIGKLFGFSVFVSSQADDDATLFYHRSTQAFARQMQMKVESDRNVLKLADEWAISHIYGLKGLDAGKRIVRIKDGGA